MSGNLSFEFFPPKTEAMEESLWRAIQRLALLRPNFVSVTYGAGGSTRERTHATVARLLAETDLVPASHLTCVNASRDELDTVARSYWDIGVRHIVALRGDAPGDTPGSLGPYTPRADGYAYASDLVSGLRRIADFEISVAAYPERHPESTSLQADLDNLKRKIDAGATRAITQFFFEADTYCRFLENARKAGITVPIVPGILPVTNFGQVCKFAKACGAAVPAWMGGLFEGLDNEPDTRQLVAATVAVKLCEKLRENGVEDFHFYTLNRAELTLAICRVLGLGARTAAPAPVA
ncbi:MULTISPECIES: methylenetetrahydrofolate reductase [NAD(P)H] [Oceanibaculum]|uniref:Methylenetetrahydrofolate reductase n=1 Tax=Oceanibaculum indicum P24 TaxID=1207063 RepID=K2KJ72_9PROT|nr:MULTISPECIES: methylenetetrahydrofolate reductase [NAD(P)H] [Oceanibaculum]EKE77350.1 methylenetetrahydrofolate reductase [Oceanibaculum indicum P24]MCH2395327.1 methylenetetrahydrofolate reductase [NAD(P)H] [Oceanibaculum sp.]